MDNPLNLEAYSIFLTDCSAFDDHTQRCLRASSGVVAVLGESPVGSQDMLVDDAGISSPMSQTEGGISSHGRKRDDHEAVQAGRKSSVLEHCNGSGTRSYSSLTGADSRPLNSVSTAAHPRRKRLLEEDTVQSSHSDYERSHFSLAAMKGEAGVGTDYAHNGEWEDPELLRSAAAIHFLGAEGSFPTLSDGFGVRENSEADLMRATNAFKRLRTDGAPFSK
jgi:hypothetical protein